MHWFEPENFGQVTWKIWCSENRYYVRTCIQECFLESQIYQFCYRKHKQCLFLPRVCTYVCMYVCMYVRVCTVCVCVCICMYVCVCVCVYLLKMFIIIIIIYSIIMAICPTYTMKISVPAHSHKQELQLNNHKYWYLLCLFHTPWGEGGAGWGVEGRGSTRGGETEGIRAHFADTNRLAEVKLENGDLMAGALLA